METVCALMISPNSVKLLQDDSGRASIRNNPNFTLSGDRMKTSGNVHDFTPEIYKDLSSTCYYGKNMKKESDVLMMKNIRNELGYTAVGDKTS